jgi:hypothetical protein
MDEKEDEWTKRAKEGIGLEWVSRVGRRTVKGMEWGRGR